MIVQILLAVLSVVAVALTQSTLPERQRCAPVFGLASQPFWLYATFTGEQWGIFGVSIVYSIIWMKGLYQSFYRGCV